VICGVRWHSHTELWTTPLLKFPPLGVSLRCWDFPHSEVTVNYSAHKIPPLRGLLHCWDFPHSEVQIVTPLLGFFPFGVDASNLSMGVILPLQVLTEVKTPLMRFLSLENDRGPDFTTGISPARRSGSPLCCWDFSPSELTHPICQWVIPYFRSFFNLHVIGEPMIARDTWDIHEGFLVWIIPSMY